MRTDRLIEMYRSATPAQRKEGLSWYHQAHLLARRMARRYGFTVGQCAAAIALLSPGVSWKANQTIAHSFLDAASRGEYRQVTYGAQCRMAWEAVQGRPWKSGPKVTAFYKGIMKNRASSVCIDRWMLRAVHHPADTCTRKEYRTIEEAFKEAARKVHLSLYEFQAVVWVTIRERGAA